MPQTTNISTILQGYHIQSSQYHIVCVCVGVTQSCPTATPWTVAHQAPLSKGFSRQEYWSGLSYPPPEDLPNPGIKLTSPASPALAGEFFTTGSHLRSPIPIIQCSLLHKKIRMNTKCFRKCFGIKDKIQRKDKVWRKQRQSKRKNICF